MIPRSRFILWLSSGKFQRVACSVAFKLHDFVNGWNHRQGTFQKSVMDVVDASPFAAKIDRDCKNFHSFWVQAPQAAEIYKELVPLTDVEAHVGI